MEPSHVLRTADYTADALTAAVGRDWSVRADRLEWDVDYTLTHLTGAPAKYALYLASRSTRFIAVSVGRFPDASQAERIDAIRGAGRALANVATMSPPDALGFHTSGMLDAPAFVAIGCVELLVHGHDVAQGFAVAGTALAHRPHRSARARRTTIRGAGRATVASLWSGSTTPRRTRGVRDISTEGP